MPYAGMTNAETKQSVINRGYRMPPPSGCPEQVAQLMHECWQYHEKVRVPGLFCHEFQEILGMVSIRYF